MFGGTTLTHNPTQEYFNDKAIGGRTVDAHNITFYDAAFETRPIGFKYNVAHEFGHAFNNLIGGQLVNDLAGGIPVTLADGTIDTETIPGGIGDNYFDNVRLNSHKARWQKVEKLGRKLESHFCHKTLECVLPSFLLCRSYFLFRSTRGD